MVQGIVTNQMGNPDSGQGKAIWACCFFFVYKALNDSIKGYKGLQGDKEPKRGSIRPPRPYKVHKAIKGL